MDRTIAANYATVSGKRAFQNANPGAGIPDGTAMDAADAQAWQEEIVGIEEWVGVAPNAADLTQLRQSISIMAGASGFAQAGPTVALTPSLAGLVAFNGTSNNITATLPAANAANGKPYHFHFFRSDAVAGNVVSVVAAGADVIYPGIITSIQMSCGQFFSLYSDGSNWISTRRGGGFLLITSSQSFIIPASVYEVEIYGGGGGGAASLVTSSGNASAGAGGNAGARGYTKFVGAQVGNSIFVTIGGGGAGAASPGAAGGNGSTSSFGSLISAPGGLGAPTTSGGPYNPPFGEPPTAPNVIATGAQINGAGELGTFGLGWTLTNVASGNGGGNALGAGADPVPFNSHGLNAATPGTGGSGGCDSNGTGWHAGGSGAAGICIVRW